MLHAEITDAPHHAQLPSCLPQCTCRLHSWKRDPVLKGACSLTAWDGQCKNPNRLTLHNATVRSWAASQVIKSQTLFRFGRNCKHFTSLEIYLNCLLKTNDGSSKMRQSTLWKSHQQGDEGNKECFAHTCFVVMFLKSARYLWAPLREPGNMLRNHGAEK